MGTLNIDEVIVTSTGLTTATTNYSNGDVIGAEGFIIIPGNLTQGILQCVTVLDEADILSGCDIVFGTAAFAWGSDNAAPSVTDANSRLIQRRISMPNAYDDGANKSMFVDSLGITLKADVGATGIPFRIMATAIAASFFGAVGDVKCRFGFLKDV